MTNEELDRDARSNLRWSIVVLAGATALLSGLVLGTLLLQPFPTATSVLVVFSLTTALSLGVAIGALLTGLGEGVEQKSQQKSQLRPSEIGGSSF